ncbi:MAG: tyrosine-type recombinase/integrase [Clostridiaceae bacterium]
MRKIEKRGESSYRLAVSCGYDKKDRQILKYKTVDLSHIKPHKQWEEAKRQYILFKDEIEKGAYLDAGKITFEDFAIKWLKEYGEANLAPKTLFGYKEMLENRIFPAIGRIKLNKLQPTHLMEFYNNLREKGIRLDTRYKPKSNFEDILKEKNITLDDLIKASIINKRNMETLKSRNNTIVAIASKISQAAGLDISALFDTAAKPGGLSERTILYYHRIISSILTCAVQWQFILNNTATRVKPPKFEKKEAAHLDIAQTGYIFQLINKEHIKYKAVLYLCIFGGMRAGELNALEWKDVNWNDNSISINKASQYLPGKGTFTKNPKNESSERLISLPPEVIAILKEYKFWQDGVKADMGNLWIETDRIFTKYNGEAIFPQSIGRWFSDFIKKHNESIMNNADIPSEEKKNYLLDKVTLHGLRHTSATLMISQKVDIATVSKRLGHANISTTLNIYTHALKELDKTASDKLGNLLLKSDQDTLKQG